MTAQLALFDEPNAPVIALPRPWTICARSEPVIPDWYEVQVAWRASLPDDWKDKDGYCYFMSPVYWNGTQWCLSDADQRPNPKGTTYPGDKQDRWRALPAGFDPKAKKTTTRWGVLTA